MTDGTSGKWLQHGGGLDQAAERFGVPLCDWLDLSTGINPHAYPLPPLDVAAWHRLPDAHAAEHLINAAQQAYNAPGSETITAAPGSQALIQLLPRLTPGKRRVAVLGPTYNEHAACWAASGHDVHPLAGAETDLGAFDTLVAVNPNNPDGRAFLPGELLALRARLSGDDPLLIVDEAFGDLVPEASLAPQADQPGVVVLRSFGKFYGLAGARVGFAIAAPDRAETIRRALGPWALSGPAIAIAARALTDHPWATEMRERLKQEADALDGVLLGRGLDVIGGTWLYRLVRHDDAASLYLHLAGQGILTRPFDTQPDRLRFGLPGSADALGRLDAALASWNPNTKRITT